MRPPTTVIVQPSGPQVYYPPPQYPPQYAPAPAYAVQVPVPVPTWSTANNNPRPPPSGNIYPNPYAR